MSSVSGFMGNLDEWVEMQRRVLRALEDMDVKLREGDRLELIVASRAVFQHLIRTLKAFDQWLQDPVITSHMPREMLVDVWGTMLQAARLVLELDIRHTSGFKEHFEKLAREGKLSPLVTWRQEKKERGKQVLPTTTI